MPYKLKYLLKSFCLAGFLFACVFVGCWGLERFRSASIGVREVLQFFCLHLCLLDSGIRDSEGPYLLN